MNEKYADVTNDDDSEIIYLDLNNMYVANLFD